MRVVVASCAKFKDYPRQPVWSAIGALDPPPNVLLLLGDNIYIEHSFALDDRGKLDAHLRELYRQQMSEQHFAKLLADVKGRGGVVSAIWDDHDFLGNDSCGADLVQYRDVSRAAFLDHLPHPHAEPTDRVFHVFDRASVRFILLDVRYDRRPEGRGWDDLDAVLGLEQRKWFLEQLDRRPLPYTVVCSGTTLHRYGPFHTEAWSDYDAAYEELCARLKARSGLLFLSGDIHRNRIKRRHGVIEVVCSGIARNHEIFGHRLENWGVLDFHHDKVDIELHGLGGADQTRATVRLGNWSLGYQGT